MAKKSKGSLENPYTMSECERMLDAGTWPGGYVRDDAGKVTYVMKSVTVTGYSGSGSGSEAGSGGSDYEFSDGSTEWHYPDTEAGCDDDGKGNPGTDGGGGAGGGGNVGGGGGTGGGTGTNMSLMTQAEFDSISKACAVTPAVSSMLKTLYDGGKIFTYPTEAYSAAARYNSIQKRLEISRKSGRHSLP